MQRARHRLCSATPILCRSACAPSPTRRRQARRPVFSSVAPAWRAKVPVRSNPNCDRSRSNMIVTATFSRRFCALLAGCVAGCVLAAVTAGAARAQTVAVMVNGEPITDLDIEARVKFDFLSTHKQPSRQEVVNELIEEKLKIKEAKKFGVD